MSNINYFKLSLLSASLLFTSYSLQSAPPPPPHEAISACFSLSTGDHCSFTHPKGTLEGICANIETQLACTPEGDRPIADGDPAPIAANYDASNGILLLPNVSIDNSLYFQVSLQLVSMAPLLFNLDEIIEVDKASKVTATYDVTTEILLVPAFNYESKHYRLIFKLIDDEPDYQFELISMEEIN